MVVLGKQILRIPERLKLCLDINSHNYKTIVITTARRKHEMLDREYCATNEDLADLTYLPNVREFDRGTSARPSHSSTTELWFLKQMKICRDLLDYSF